MSEPPAPPRTPPGVPPGSPPGVAPLLDEGARRLAVTTVAAALIGWWPAFTLGVYGVVFFEQQLALWVAATSVFVVVLVGTGGQAVRRPAVWALLLPSTWLVLNLVLPAGGSSWEYRVLYWLGLVVTILGTPAMAAQLIRLLVPGAQRLRGRAVTVAVLVVLTVMAASFGLGRLHQRILTCEDFTISGNFAPPGCSEGRGTTVLD